MYKHYIGLIHDNTMLFCRHPATVGDSALNFQMMILIAVIVLIIIIIIIGKSIPVHSFDKHDLLCNFCRSGGGFRTAEQRGFPDMPI